MEILKTIEAESKKVFSPPVQCLIRAIVEGGKLLEELPSGSERGKVSVKDDDPFARAITTGFDITSQTAILRVFLEFYPSATFFVEEKKQGDLGGLNRKARIFQGSDISRLSKIHHLFMVDSLDGTALHPAVFPRALPIHFSEYSTGGCYFENGEPKGGVIFMPKFSGGVLAAAERNKGGIVYICKSGAVHSHLSFTDDADGKVSVLYWGADLDTDPRFNSLKNELAQKNRRVLVANSGLAALLFVTLGLVDAVIQGHQAPENIFPGIPLLEIAKRGMVFYHYREGIITRLKKPDPISFSQEIEIDGSKGRPLAFIAAKDADYAEELFEILKEKWGK